MDWYISYFYQIRFMNKTMVPVSTATWDPKWFHQNNGNNFVFRDKNDVINGLRCVWLNPSTIYDEHSDCGSNACNKMADGNWCNFLLKYYDYLNTLDFNGLIQMMETHCKKLQPDCESICLIVHETFDNPCSERVPLIRWFREHGIELKPFMKVKNS